MIFYLLACGTKVPSALQNNAIVQLPNCNNKDYIVARGVDTTPERSVKNAHQQISENIISQIESEVEIIDEYVSKTRSFNGRMEDNTVANETLRKQIKVKSSFKHNELIEDIIDPVKVGSYYRSLSCLNKGKTNRVLTDDLRPKANNFSNLATTAKEFHQKDDVPGFSINYNKAMQTQSDIAASLYVIRSATSRRSSLEAPYRETLKSLEDSAEAIRSQLSIGVKLIGEVEYHNKAQNKKMVFADSQILLDAFTKGLSDSALNVITTSGCNSRTTHFISVEIRPDCPSYHPMGFAECSLMFYADIHDCKNQTHLELAVADKNWKGSDQYDSAKALYKAAKSPKGKGILQKELRNYFPILTLQ